MTLITSVAQLAGAPGGPAGLSLPGGGSVNLDEDGADLLVRIELRGSAGSGAAVAAALILRVAPGPSVTPQLAFSASRTGPAGSAAGIEVEAGTGLRIGVRLTPPPAGSPEIVIPLYPETPGLGALSAIGAQAVEYALPRLLNELRALAEPGDPADPRLKQLATALNELVEALDLTAPDGTISITQLRLLASAPAAELQARFRRSPGAVVAAVKSLARALIGDTPAQPPVLWRSPGGRIVADVETTAEGEPRVSVTTAGLHPLPGVDADLSVAVTPSGLEPSQLSLAVSDPDVLLPGPVDLRPFVRARLGDGADCLELGIWLDPPGAPDREALVLRLPGDPLLVHRRGAADSADLAGAVPKLLQRLAIPLATDLALSQSALRELLESSGAGDVLDEAGVLSHTGTAPDRRWRLAAGLLDDPVAHVLRALVGFLDDALPELGPVTLSLLQAADGAGRTRYGIGLSLAPEPYRLTEVAGIVVALSGDGAWEPAGDPAAPHLELWVASLPDRLGVEPPQFAPALRVRGLGLVTTAAQGPLLDLGVRIQAVTLHASYLREGAEFRHAGAQFAIKGLAVPLGSASGGSNPVVGKILQPDAAGGDATAAAPGFDAAMRLWKPGASPVALRLSAGLGPGPWWLPIEKSFGPLYIEQVGLAITYDGDQLREIGLLVDGGVTLGGFAMGVDDLALHLPWASPANPATWRLDLAGLAIAYSGPSVNIAGGLRKRERDGGVEYAGMLKVEAGGFGLTAVGAYGSYPVSGTAERYTSMFGFAALAAPIGGPPAFFVMGLGAGLGLNRGLALPERVTEIGSFPLVAAMDPDGPLIRDPMGALDQLGVAFPARRGSFWLAAGVRFTSFTVVESIAVLAIAFGEDVEVILLGLSRMGLPNPAAPIVSVELALRARFSAREGVISVEAQLTDNSWLLNPDCRLSGGFAMLIWLRTGEFLLSLGGYHPRFTKPAKYPDVPRLGINWRVSDAITIKGESYFTLTSSCVMAGARAEAAFDGGFVQASFVAGLDALVSWDPFFYDVSVYIGVSVRLEIDIKVWFVHIRISIGFAIGAELRVWGPPLRGLATLDLDVSRVEVAFGATDPALGAESLGWAGFHDKYLVAGDPVGETMTVSVRSGQVAADPGADPGSLDDGSAERPLRLLTEFTLVSTTRTASNRAAGQDLGGAALDLGPMRVADVISEHQAVVTPVATDGTLGTPVNLQATPIRGSVPDGVWRIFDSVEVDEGGVREAFTGLALTAVTVVGGGTRTGTLADVETGPDHSLPLSEERDPGQTWSAAMAAAVTWAAEQTGQDALALAAEFSAEGAGLRAFARCLGPGADIPSGFAVRLLGADRTAPPRLARITEGLVAPPRKPKALTLIRPTRPPDPTYPPVEPPVLLAVLRPPADPAAPGGRTTVRRSEWRRRPPPTLAEAREQALPTAAELVMRSALAGHPKGGGAVARDTGRRFVRSGEEREVLRGFAAADHAVPWLRQAGQRLASPGGVPLGAGQVQVWRLRRAAADRQDDRPRLVIEGDQQLRVVTLDRAGEALLDLTVNRSPQEVRVPRGTQTIVLAGMGAPIRRGLVGWHAGSICAQVSPGVCLVPGGRVRGSAPLPTRALRPVQAALVPGSALLAERGLLVTDLPGDTRCVIVLLARAASADGLLLGLDGTQRSPGPPLLIDQDGQAVLLYEVIPQGAAWSSVTIGYDERHRPAGVLGSPRPPERVARELLRLGLTRLLAPLAGDGPGASTVTWIGGA
ncbi:DUF6603 domain-containing protein [Nonomuraea sp. JJY05]|uniref:DUF6603 domain-containing protein n=1 Tax=Nonomuraea sp. JJY05 TaxID=3350255 RepID=UPI00373EC8C1